MRSAFTILKIETKLLFRNPLALFFNIAFPTLMLIMFGTIYGNEPTPYFNGLGTIDASISGYVGMVIAVAAMLSFPLTLAEYKEYKVYKRLDATPIQKEKIIIYQFFASLNLILVGLILLFLVGIVGYDVTITGQPQFIASTILLSIVSLFSFGFFLTAISKNLKMSNLLCFASYFAMIFLSGASVPVESFPESMKFLSNFMPLTYVVRMLKSSFIGDTLSSTTNDMLVVAGFGLVCFILGLLFYRRKNWD